MKKYSKYVVLFSIFCHVQAISQNQNSNIIFIPCHDTNLKITKSYSDSTIQTIYSIFASDTALFWWEDPNNCEDRANAMCKILNHWNVENGKIWIFNQAFPTKRENNSFKNSWAYHVAPIIILRDKNGKIDTLVIDPASFSSEKKALNVASWASKIITRGCGYYMVTSDKLYQHLQGDAYCQFDSKCWNDNTDRDEIKGYKCTTIMGVSGYNGATLFQKIKTHKYKSERRLRTKWYQFQLLMNLKLYLE